MKDQILVTGGAGFIGSHLVDTLLSKGHRVICVDNLITGSLDNLAHLKNNPQFFFIRHDVAEPLSEDEEKKCLNLRCIYHLASPASPPKYQNYSVETMLVNSVGSYNMLNLAVKNPGCVFLLASTSEVYGDPLVHPQTETYFGNVNPNGIRACYDESKRFAEALVMEFFRKKRIPVRIARIFNTYGPRMQADDGRVVTNFINQALNGRKLTVYGKGDQTRSFCYVDDLVAGLVKLAETENINGEVFNLGNPDEKTIREIGEFILLLTGRTHLGFRYYDKPQDDPERRKPDISKARKILGWFPKVQLKDGLSKTVQYFQSVRS